MDTTINAYNKTQAPEHEPICALLTEQINRGLPGAASKIWHAHPVWFFDDNPIVGYSPRKDGSICLMFWSGQSFDESGLSPEGSFKAAEIRYKHENDINLEDLQRWLEKSRTIQWDYKNIVKHTGLLRRSI